MLRFCRIFVLCNSFHLASLRSTYFSNFLSLSASSFFHIGNDSAALPSSYFERLSFSWNGVHSIRNITRSWNSQGPQLILTIIPWMFLRIITTPLLTFMVSLQMVLWAGSEFQYLPFCATQLIWHFVSTRSSFRSGDCNSKTLAL